MLFSLQTFTVLRNMPDKRKFMLRCLLTVRRSFLCVGIHILYLRWSLDFPECKIFFKIPSRPPPHPPAQHSKQKNSFQPIERNFIGIEEKIEVGAEERGGGTFIAVLSYSSSFYILRKQFYFPWSHPSFPILFQSTHICYMYFFPPTFSCTLSIYTLLYKFFLPAHSFHNVHVFSVPKASHPL